ncbi:transcriptional regulator [Frondihabitans sp. PAMC 28766]|uniref:helix-turn-helix transcriptional regulator n=1 Tax=Frondihabitans sp. PAMC 28766 TaxID=1795630 RepID=UPI00078E8971|nr:WYL domain-containing protein [Frondihabitans sp. PAMC 28766]AMM20049.1 transcriptional regulator [Frondihabitans sp. PAMC 28766]
MTTSTRMLQLLSLLQARRDWPGQLLAERLYVSERTVRRDVDRLRELGYRVHAVKGPDGGYRLEAGSELPPLLFDDEQAIVLAVALQTVRLSGIAIEEAAARALTTVRQVMPSRLRHRVDALQVTTVQDAGNPSPEGISPDTLATLGAAVQRSEVVRFDYADDLRRVEPHHVVARGGRWYLVAFDLDRAGWRTFSVDRISLRTPNGPRFERREVPGGDVGAYLTGRFRGETEAGVSGEWGSWPCRGVVILHRPAAAIAPYRRDETVEDLGGGRCRVTLGSYSWEALAAEVARLGGDFEVESPAELGEACGVLAARFDRAAG